MCLSQGEDPLVVGEYGAHFVRAMQGVSKDGKTKLVTVAPKHFLNYDLEGRKNGNWSNVYPGRNDFNAIVSKQEQLEYYLPAWHATMTVGQPGSVMCSTNRVNGVDSCMNPTYIDGFLRDKFNFTGFVVTDGGSCGNPNCRATVALRNASAAAEWSDYGHELAAKLCITAGTDIELGTTLTSNTDGALKQNMLPARDISRANTRLYTQMVQQGHLELGPNDKLGMEEVDTPRSRQIAFEAAADAMVLLKNEPVSLHGLVSAPLLPLPSDKGLKIALVGPHLHTTKDLQSGSGYAGESKLVMQNTIFQAFERRAAAGGPGGGIEIVGVAPGCDITWGCADANLTAVAAAVADADVVLAFVGLHPCSGAAPEYGTACAESEAWDRYGIDLCGQQPAILEAALAGGKPLVTVMINGGTIAARWIKAKSTAVLEGWYPGQAGGEAVVAVLLGDRNPTGRLPVTVYDESLAQSRKITDMSLRSNNGLTYMHYRGTALWPFGYGMSYTNWSVALDTAGTGLLTTTDALKAAWAKYYSPEMDTASVADLEVTVTNTGARMSAVVVLVFATATTALPAGSLAPPLRQLVGFSRASALGAGEVRRVAVALVPLPLCRADAAGSQWAEPGVWRLAATVDGVDMVHTTLTVSGSARNVLEWPVV